MDSAVSAAKELELTEKLTEIVEDYMAAVHELNAGTGLLVRAFSPLIPALDTTVKAVRGRRSFLCPVGQGNFWNKDT